MWVVWGSTYIAIRVADESLPPLAMAGTRYLIAGALLFPVARRSGGPGLRAVDRPGLAQWLGMAAVGAMLLAFGNGAVSYAETTLPAGLTALLVATVPIWMVLADRIINGRTIPRASWLALVIGVAGVGILARPHGHGSVVPVLIALGGGLSSRTAAVSTYAYVNPVIAVALGTLLLSERPTLTTVLGGAIVLASVALLLRHRSRTAA